METNKSKFSFLYETIRKAQVHMALLLLDGLCPCMHNKYSNVQTLYSSGKQNSKLILTMRPKQMEISYFGQKSCHIY